MAKRKIACLNDQVGNFDGYIMTTAQNGKLKVNGETVAVDLAVARRPGEWTRNIIPTVTKTFYNGKQIIVEGDETTAGNVVHPNERYVYVE